MKLKLSHKLFMANVGIILALVMVMQAVSYVYNKKLINDFIVRIDAEKLDDLAMKMGKYYAEHQSWSDLIENNNKWHEAMLVRPRHRFSQNGSPENASSDFKHPKFKRPDFKRPDFEPRFGEKPPYHQQSLNMPPDFQERGFKGMPSMASNMFFNRVALLDKKQNILIKSVSGSSPMTYQKIWVGQDVVGWLTIDELNIDNAPRADRYLQQQISYTLWVAGIGILIAGAFSFFLSRHITAPIKILNDSAAEIAKRNFQTHISVNTKDELNELANSFNHISKELLRFENRQKQWLIDISHDLRTPLTILNGEMQAMNDDVIPCNKDTILSLQEEVDLLIRLVDDLHELSMMDSAEFYCLDEDVELKQLTLNQLQKYNTKFSSRKINVHHNIELASIVIRGDQNRLAQVIHNILENNFRYTESSGDIWVSLKEDQDWASIIIEDSGPGVSEFALVKLFDRLFRTDSSRNRKTGGAGIGLAICHNIIKAHGGLISAQQSQYGGLSIIIQLPIKSEVRD